MKLNLNCISPHVVHAAFRPPNHSSVNDSHYRPCSLLISALNETDSEGEQKGFLLHDSRLPEITALSYCKLPLVSDV